ncbi:collagen alpha-1(XXI) chain-like isoform X1 [Styela clava]
MLDNSNTRLWKFELHTGILFQIKQLWLKWEKDKRTKMLGCSIRNNELLFVLDGSGSVLKKNFLIVKNWVKTITKKLNIDKGAVRVGVVQYSEYDNTLDIQKQPQIKTYVKIGQYTDYQSFAAAMDEIPFLSGPSTHTGEALKKVVYDFKNTEHFKEAKQVMVLLTDGKASDTEKSISANAKTLRDMGVTTYAVGVGNYERRELRLIANGNPLNDTGVFKAKNFDALDAIANELQNEIDESLALEGSNGGQTTAGYKMEFGAVGIVAAYSTLKPEIRRLRNDTRTNSVTIIY